MPDLSPATIQHGVHRSAPVGTKSQAVQASQRSFNDMLLRGQRVVPAPKLEVQMICNLGRSWEEGCFAKPTPGVRDRDTYEIDGSRSEQDSNPCFSHDHVFASSFRRLSVSGASRVDATKTRTEDFRETSRLLSSLDQWPAITEIEQPDLRSWPRLTGRAHTVRSTRIPARSHRVNLSENPVGIDFGITWEYGNRTGFLRDLQESSERMRAKATLAPPAAIAPRVAAGPLTSSAILGHRPPRSPPRADATEDSHY